MTLRARVSRDISLTPVEDRWYRVNGCFSVEIWGDFPGRKQIDVDDGFMMDGRSGPRIVDYLIPNLGSQPELKTFLVHDLFSYDIGLTFSENNELFYNNLRGPCGYSWVTAKLAWACVSASDSYFGQPAPGDREYPNLGKIKVRHFDK